MSNDIYATPNSQPDYDNKTQSIKAGLLVKVFCVILTLLTMLIGFSKESLRSGEPGVAVGGALAAIIWGLIIVGLFQIGKSYRNQRSRYKIYLWCQIIFFITQLFALVKIVTAMGV